VLPTVYQCLYSLIVRRAEKELFPTLRRLGIRIQAYSSLASGFLVKTPQEVKDGVGNFDRTTVFGKVLQAMYGNESQLLGLEAYRELCDESGLGHLGMAYRWVVWNSALGSSRNDGQERDMVILGASRADQLRDAVEEIRKGPLDEWISKGWTRSGRLWRMMRRKITIGFIRTC
jgi:aflatoxin B1 aldehyde reductase